MRFFTDIERESLGVICPHVLATGTSYTSALTRGITPVIPPNANRNIKRECDFALYCERNLIKHFRAIATRYDKLAKNFLAGTQLAAVTILLN
jgi:transposase